MQPASFLTPPPIATEAFTDAAGAVARLDEIYQRNTAFLRDHFEAYANGAALATRVRATYPLVRITTASHARVDSRLAYGFVARPGVHETSVTRPDLFRSYFTEQIGLLIENHRVPVEIGESDEPIAVHFAYRRDINIAAARAGNAMADRPLRDAFDVPDLAAMDDAIANDTLELPPGAPAPLALFRAARRLLAAPALPLHRHRSGALPELRDLHQLPVLCRRLRAAVRRAPVIGPTRLRGLC
jgi:AMP nucleosidase